MYECGDGKRQRERGEREGEREGREWRKWINERRDVQFRKGE